MLGMAKKKSDFGRTIGWAYSSLATQFWPLYVINEQQGRTIDQVWDGDTLKLSFRRSVSE
jgi:hypothetical protein